MRIRKKSFMKETASFYNDRGHHKFWRAISNITVARAYDWLKGGNTIKVNGELLTRKTSRSKLVRIFG